MRKTLHLCLVSSQLQPNVIPWVELKPERTLLLASEKVHAEATQLLKIAHDLGIKADRYTNVIPTSSYADLQKYFLDLAVQLPTDTDIAVNLTGGTKLMTLAAVDVLAAEGYQFFYTDTDNRQIEFLSLNKAVNTHPPHAFQDTLKIKQLIACGMASLHSTGTTDPQRKLGLHNRKPLIDEFTRAAINNVSCISKLNEKIDRNILADNGRSLKQNKLQLELKEENAFRKAFSEAHLHELLHYDSDNAILHFRNAAQARWLHGIWLEEYVWHQMRAAGIKQCDTGVELQWHLPEYKARQQLANEIDAIAAQDNRLYIVECKTGKLEHEGKQDILHKLSRLTSQLAGPFGSALLVSLHPPSHSIADRARHSNITIVCGQQLLNLKQHFSDWIAQR